MANEPVGTNEELLSPELISRLEHLQLLTHKVFRGKQKGERRSRKKGQSIDFADYRNYVRGDDTRFIDWNLFARLEKLFIKLFLEEEDLAFYIIVDTSKSMDFGTPETKFQYARRLAAALSYIGLANQDKVGVTAFSSNASQIFRPAMGKGQLIKLMAFLKQIQVQETTNLQRSIRDFLIRHRQHGVVVIISDFLDEAGYEDALKQLVSRPYEVYLIHLLSREERNPAVLGHLELVDSESGHKQEITVSQGILEQYQKTLEVFCSGLRDWSMRRGMNYLPATTEEPIEHMLLNYLKDRGLLR